MLLDGENFESLMVSRVVDGRNDVAAITAAADILLLDVAGGDAPPPPLVDVPLLPEIQERGAKASNALISVALRACRAELTEEKRCSNAWRTMEVVCLRMTAENRIWSLQLFCVLGKEEK